MKVKVNSNLYIGIILFQFAYIMITTGVILDVVPMPLSVFLLLYTTSIICGITIVSSHKSNMEYLRGAAIVNASALFMSILITLMFIGISIFGSGM